MKFKSQCKTLENAYHDSKVALGNELKLATQGSQPPKNLKSALPTILPHPFLQANPRTFLKAHTCFSFNVLGELRKSIWDLPQKN